MCWVLPPQQPEGTYAELVRKYEAGELDFSRVRTVNLDEYVGLPVTHDQSYRYFMNDHLFDHVNIDKANTNVPNGMELDEKQECARYEALIAALGGIDLQLLALGPNGHVGFNEPCGEFIAETHKVQLTETTIRRTDCP